jgi:hypothetical protein
MNRKAFWEQFLASEEDRLAIVTDESIIRTNLEQEEYGGSEEKSSHKHSSQRLIAL